MRFKDKKEKRDNRKRAYTYLTEKKGFEPHIAAGIIGNFMQEAGASLNVEAYNPDDLGKESFGLAQWRGDRLKRLKEVAGDKFNTIEGQLDFMVWEFQNTEKRAFQKLREAKTPEEAALTFSKYYERPHKDYAHNNKRVENALNLFTSYGVDDKGYDYYNDPDGLFKEENKKSYLQRVLDEYRTVPTESFEGFEKPKEQSKVSPVEEAVQKLEKKKKEHQLMQKMMKASEVQHIDINESEETEENQFGVFKEGGKTKGGGDKEEKKPKKVSRNEWKEKYGSDTHYYTHNLDKVDLTTGKTIRQLIEEASKKYGLDPSFLASTLFTEGLDKYDMFDEESNPFKREDYNEYPVSGMKYLGLDTIGNRKHELFKKGLVDPEEYKKNVVESQTYNEKDEKVISADAKNLGYGIELTAAFLKNENENIDRYAEENGIELNPVQRTFFRNVAYNAGLGNAQDMLTSYHKRGYLKDNNFIQERPNQYWQEVHQHAKKRTTAGIGLYENAGFNAPEGIETYYEGFSQPREEATSLATTILPNGRMPVQLTEQRDIQNPVSSIANSEGIVATDATVEAGQLARTPETKGKQSVISSITGNNERKQIAKNNIEATLLQTIPDIPEQEVSREVPDFNPEGEFAERIASYFRENKVQPSETPAQKQYDIDLGDRGIYAFGEKDDNIKNIQKVLKDKGYYSGSIDGIYGKKTYQAVQQLQKDSNIRKDGIFGKETLGALNNI